MKTGRLRKNSEQKSFQHIKKEGTESSLLPQTRLDSAVASATGERASSNNLARGRKPKSRFGKIRERIRSKSSDIVRKIKRSKKKYFSDSEKKKRKNSAVEKTADDHWNELYEEWKKAKAKSLEEEKKDDTLKDIAIAFVHIFDNDFSTTTPTKKYLVKKER